MPIAKRRQGLGSGRSDTLQAGAYGATRNGPLYAAAALAFAESWMSTSRIALGDLAADFNGQCRRPARGGLAFAADARHGGARHRALCAVQTQVFHTPGYSERDLGAGGFAASRLRVTVGV